MTDRSTQKTLTAIESLIDGLVDYAGLYPPASLDMRPALENYLAYARDKHAAALGRFIVNIDRLAELREPAGDSMSAVALSLIASPSTDWTSLQQLLSDGVPIRSIEIKCDQPSEIERICRLIPSNIETYFELPISAPASDSLAAISSFGARAKLRMGGLISEAFPSTVDVAAMLKSLADHGISFKATAGLHHPIRSQHAFTYAPDSPVGTMHGFVNLFLAAALLHLGGDITEANLLLDEEDPTAFDITPQLIGWRSYLWNSIQLCAVRKKFAISFGSCSFEEPIHDLEALGWL